MRKIIGLSLSAILIIVLACTKDKGVPTPATPNPNDVVDSTKLIDVQYNRDIKPILVTYCDGKNGQSCHVSNSNIGANGDFTTYAGLKAKVDNGSIDSRVFQPGGGMPPVYSNSPQKLTATDLAVFKKWVQIGAPNN